ncbi:MAG: DUF2975 domain-containing protein [Lachnospiraceae bacterium]|nr:DUF2975 domain-containing protein [Lachnospiraceae bacterium]MBR6697569.1 DUF2975 domain-containing protein [Lachnospiraceae bacterium]
MKEKVTIWTKRLLDLMFWSGIVVTATLPLSIRIIGSYFDEVKDKYGELVVIYFVLGVAGLVIVRELRKMFKTVLDKNCFVEANVISLKKMSKWSFFIVAMSLVRTVVYLTFVMLVIILVFVMAALFCLVLANVFEEAIRYKEENDFTI